MGHSFATFGTYTLAASLRWIMRALNSQGYRLWRLNHPSHPNLQSHRTLPPWLRNPKHRHNAHNPTEHVQQFKVCYSRPPNPGDRRALTREFARGGGGYHTDRPALCHALRLITHMFTKVNNLTTRENGARHSYRRYEPAARQIVCSGASWTYSAPPHRQPPHCAMCRALRAFTRCTRGTPHPSIIVNQDAASSLVPVEADLGIAPWAAY